MAYWDDLIELGEVYGEMFRNWNKKEFRKFRERIVIMALIPIGFLIVGILAGAQSWWLKVQLVPIGMIWAGGALFLMGARQAVWAAALVAAGAMVNRATGGTGMTAAELAERYIRALAGLIASILGLGLLIIWFPVHDNPGLGLLIIATVVAAIAHSVWMKGGNWWSGIVKYAVYGTMLLAAMMLALPETTSAVRDTYLIGSDKAGGDAIRRLGKDGVSFPALPSFACQTGWAAFKSAIILIFVACLGLLILAFSVAQNSMVLKVMGLALVGIPGAVLLTIGLGVSSCTTNDASATSKARAEAGLDSFKCVGSTLNKVPVTINLTLADWDAAELDPLYLQRRMAEGCSAIIRWMPFAPEHLPKERWVVTSPQLYLPQRCSLVAGPHAGESPRYFWQNDRRIDAFQYNPDPHLPFRLDAWKGPGSVDSVSVSINCS